FESAAFERRAKREAVEIEEPGGAVRELGGAEGREQGRFHVSPEGIGIRTDRNRQINPHVDRRWDVGLIAGQTIPVEKVDELYVFIQRYQFGPLRIRRRKDRQPTSRPAKDCPGA